MKVDFDFSLVKSEVQSSLVILKSRPMLPAYFCHVPFMKISTSCLWYSLSILKVTFLKSNPFRFKETLILFNIKYKWHHEKGGAIRHCYGKCWSKLLLTKQTLRFIFFSILWHKVWVLIYNMFIFEKVGHSKFVERHGNTSNFFSIHFQIRSVLFLLIAIYL